MKTHGTGIRRRNWKEFFLVDWSLGIVAPMSDSTPNISKLRTVCTRLLDTVRTQPYSLPFRTSGLKQTKQRPVGSVGVEALRRLVKLPVDKYCGVNGMRRGWFFRPFPRIARAGVNSFSSRHATPQKSFGSREATIRTRPIANSERP
jgi:hypothetical protein